MQTEAFRAKRDSAKESRAMTPRRVILVHRYGSLTITE